MRQFRGMVYPYVGWLAVMVLVPMLMILLYAFTTAGNDVTTFRFTLDNFVRFLTDKVFLDVLKRSLLIAFATTIVCVGLGYPIAYVIAKGSERSGFFWVMMITLPTWINMLVRTYAWVGILQDDGLLNNLLGMFGIGPFHMMHTTFAVVIGMVYNFIPFMILQIHSSLAKMDRSLIEAANDLGANPVQSFLRVTLPLSLPGVLSGITLVFLPAVSSFFIPKLLGGGQYVLVGNVIETQFLTSGDWNFGSAISLIMAVIIMISMWLTRKVDTDPAANGKGREDMHKKNGIGGKLLLAATMIFFYLPILYIIVFSFNESRSLTHFGGFSLRWYEKMFADSTMMEAVVYTVVIAILATIISTVAGTLAAIGMSKSKKLLRSMVEQVNNLPIMNPEIVTAIGLLMFFSAIGIKKGFLTLLLAHIMFCIPYVILSVMPKLRSLDPNLADAAMDLGATPFQALMKVIVPQIMPGIISGALIAFTMSFDDFIISYFVTGNGVQNISILVYTMSKRVNPSINALSTLMIILITVVLTIVNVVPVIREKQGKTGQPISKAAIAIGMAVVIAVGGFGVSVLRGGASPEDAIAKYGSDTLKLYNWGEYMGENLITNFEEEYGVDVIVEYFDSNEMMYTKLQAGDSYDVLVPSDYMIQRMMNEDMLQELDLDLIPNLDNLAEGVQNLPYDPNNQYSVPYFWGTVGIVYNHNNVDPSVVEEQGYNILHNTDYKDRIYIYDSERDSFMMALKALGYSMNTDNLDEIYAAYDWLLQMNNTMNPAYVTDEVIDGMINGDKDIAVVYSGDATYILDENEDMSFWNPMEGTNVWSDAMVIPKNASNPLLAHEFINYVLTYEASLDNSEYVGYTSSNEEVMLELSSDEGTYGGNVAYLPRVGYEKDEVFEDNPVLKKTLAELWIKVKASK